MKRLLFFAAAIFVLGCDDNDSIEGLNVDITQSSHLIVCKNPDGSLLEYKRSGTVEWGNLPFRSRNAIWQFEGERNGKMYKVATTFCHIEEEIKD